jgi:hypothetical protein
MIGACRTMKKKSVEGPNPPEVVITEMGHKVPSDGVSISMKSPATKGKDCI